MSGLSRATVVRLIGWLLFAASFAMPDADFGENGIVWSENGRGYGAFAATPVFLFKLVENGGGWRIWIAGIVLAASWLSN